MKDLIFLTSITYPSQLANRVHVRNMCKAFEAEQVRVTLLMKSYEGKEVSSEMIALKGGNIVLLAYWAFIFLKKSSVKVVYCREPRLFFFVKIFSIFSRSVRKKKIIFEVHDEPFAFFDHLIFYLIAHSSKLLVVLTPALRDYMQRYCVFRKVKPILVLEDGVDLELFQDVVKDPNFLDKQLKLPPGNPIAMYSGSCARWKGVYLLVDAAKKLPNVSFVIVGGKDKERKKLKMHAEGIKNIYFVRHVFHEDVPKYLSSADVLLLPNSGLKKVSVKYTSPLKMFEYMASGTPVVASRLPSIAHVLEHGVTAEFFEADVADDLIRAISKIIQNQKYASYLSKNAQFEVKKYAWNLRARSIISHFENQN